MTEALAERIDRAIAWWEANRYEVIEALPLGLPWVVITPRAAIHLDRAIAEYRAGKLSPKIVEPYLLWPLRRLYRAFEMLKLTYCSIYFR